MTRLTDECSVMQWCERIAHEADVLGWQWADSNYTTKVLSGYTTCNGYVLVVSNEMLLAKLFDELDRIGWTPEFVNMEYAKQQLHMCLVAGELANAKV